MSVVIFAATYDGTPLLEVVSGTPRKLIGLVKGLDDSPEVRGSDTIIPGATGRTARSRVWDRLVIFLEGPIMGVGDTHAEQMADVREILDELTTLFDPTRDPATLEVELEDGSSRVIEARPLNIMLDPPTIPVVRQVSIELEAIAGTWSDGS